MSAHSSSGGSVSRSSPIPSRGRLPLNVVVLVSYFVIAIISVQWQRTQLMDRLIVSAGTEAAREHVETLAAVRTVYTEEILPIAQEHGLQVALQQNGDGHSLPLPVTFTMRIGERMADSGRRGRTRLYSPYPFPWRVADGGLRDDFQKEAWERLNADPSTPVVQSVAKDDGRVLRYAIADRMRASCIKCHNEHPDSPRRDWNEGDVRGVLEVEIPLTQAEAQASSNLMESTALLVVLAAVGGVVVVYTMRQFTRVSAELEHRVQERTTELGTANLALQSQVAQREHAQQARQASEERLNLALKSAGVGTWSWNVGSDVITWDDYIPTLFGRETGTLSPRFDDFITMVHIDDRERVTRDVRRTVEEGIPYDTEYRVIWPDGSQHVLGARGKVYRDATGQVLHMTGVCWDITVSRRTARELQESQERFALALEGSRDGIWDWNVTTGEVFFSARWKSMLGYAEEEITNEFSEWERLVRPEDLPRAKQILQAYFDGQRSEYSVEFRMAHKSGGWRWILARGIAQRDASGKAVRMSGSHTDITERKTAEQTLASVNAQLAGVLAASTQVSIIATDVHGLITVFNSGAENLLGYTAEEMVGKHHPGLFHRSEEVLVRGAELTRELGYPVEGFEVFVAHAKQGRFDLREWTYVRQDGGEFPVSLVVTAVRNAAGEITGFLGLAEDITDQKQAQWALARQAEELTRSNRELEQFAYIASHDLQEPLRKVQTFSDMIATEAGSTLSPEGHDYLQRMRSAAARMQTLINDLLTYSRVASQAKPFERVNLAQVTQEVLSDLEIRIQSTGGRVEVGELPHLDADPIQMRQLLQNLIGNALKFHRPGVPPVVTVQSRPIHSPPGNGTGHSASPEMCEITVQDNGIGFDEKYVDRIFIPFKRLHGRGEYEGTGIGLAICHKIVERHGGTITARSVPDEGTRMIVTLPRVPAPEVNQHAQDR